VQALIKNRSDWATSSNEEVLNYEIKKSIYDTVSSVIIATPDAIPSEGDFIILDGMDYIGVIKTVTVDKGKTTIGCNQIVTVFNRSIFYDYGTFTYMEDYLADLINVNYKTVSDGNYAMPYLTVTATTHTSGTTVPEVKDNVFTVQSYISLLRRLHNIRVTFTASRTGLAVSIAKVADTEKKIDFSNPDYTIVSENYSEKTIDKITSYCTESTKMRNWYLNTDGSITSDAETQGTLWALNHQDLTFTNVSASAWATSSEYEGYPYKSVISLRGVTANHLVSISLDNDDTNSKCISSVANSGTNTVTIYSTANNISITIPQIVCQVVK